MPVYTNPTFALLLYPIVPCFFKYLFRCLLNMVFVPSSTTSCSSFPIPATVCETFTLDPFKLPLSPSTYSFSVTDYGQTDPDLPYLCLIILHTSIMSRLGPFCSETENSPSKLSRKIKPSNPSNILMNHFCTLSNLITCYPCIISYNSRGAA